MTIIKYSSPTTFKGIDYRSKLEAKWAAFFDALDVRVEYEPQGFMFHDPVGQSISYRPDFYFPEFEAWGEVKPVAPTRAESAKAEMLSKNTHQAVYIFIGPPQNDVGQVWIYDPEFQDDEVLFAHCDTCHQGGFAYYGNLHCQCESIAGGIHSPRVKRAIESARRIQDNWKKPKGN